MDNFGALGRVVGFSHGNLVDSSEENYTENGGLHHVVSDGNISKYGIVY